MGNHASCFEGGGTKDTCQNEWNNGEYFFPDTRGPCLWVGGDDEPCINAGNKDNCSVFKEEGLCEERTKCIWDNASCREKSKCPDYSDQSSCPKTCTWDANTNECKKEDEAPQSDEGVQKCVDYTFETCPDGCVKLKETNECLYSICDSSSNTEKGICENNDMLCKWENDSCVPGAPAIAIEISSCSDYDNQQKCLAYGCHWNAKGSKCLFSVCDEDGMDEESCKLKSECIWEDNTCKWGKCTSTNESNCIADKDCRWDSTRKSCEIDLSTEIQ